MKKTYLVFVIQGYTSMEDSRLTDVIAFEIIAKTEAEAIKRAKSIKECPHYRLAQIIEKYDNS